MAYEPEDFSASQPWSEYRTGIDSLQTKVKAELDSHDTALSGKLDNPAGDGTKVLYDDGQYKDPPAGGGGGDGTILPGTDPTKAAVAESADTAKSVSTDAADGARYFNAGNSVPPTFTPKDGDSFLWIGDPAAWGGREHGFWYWLSGAWNFGGGIPDAGGGGGTPGVSFVGYAPGHDNGGNTVTIAKPAGTVDGHRMFAFLTVDAADNPVTPPAGWTHITTSAPASGTSVAMHAYYRDANSEGASYTFTLETPQYATGHIVTLAKVGTWTALDSNISESVTTDITTGSVTVPTNGILLAAFGNDSAAVVATPPTGMVETETHDSPNTTSQAVYYAPLEGAITRDLVWSLADNNISIAVAVGAV